MLRRIAYYVQLEPAKRHFESTDLETCFDGSPDFARLWEKFMDDARQGRGIPLMKILVAPGSQGASAGEFQFKHLSFQEALAADAVARDDALIEVLWSDDAVAA